MALLAAAFFQFVVSAPNRNTIRSLFRTTSFQNHWMLSLKITPATIARSRCTSICRPRSRRLRLSSSATASVDRTSAPRFIGKHWAARGYVAVFVQHPGSDEGVWRGKPFAERLPAMRKAAGLDNFMLRVKDIPAVLDQLDHWNQNPNHALAGRLDMKKIGMSGHSFGAVTTQAVSGQTFPLGGTSLTDKRIKAAISFSPSSPRKGIEPKQAFGSVKIPWMLMTGTKDVAPIGDQDVKSRLAVFPALPPGGKYELVLDNAEHSVFTERPLPGEKEKRNPNHHRVILALSTAFWDTYLRDDAQAKGLARWRRPEKRCSSRATSGRRNEPSDCEVTPVANCAGWNIAGLIGRHSLACLR